MESKRGLDRLGERTPRRRRRAGARLVVAGILLAALLASACGSGTSSAKPPSNTSGSTTPTDTSLGTGVTDRLDQDRHHARRLRLHQAVHRQHPRGPAGGLRGVHQGHQRQGRHRRSQDRSRVQVVLPELAVAHANTADRLHCARAGRQRVRGDRDVRRLLGRRADLRRQAAEATARDVRPDAGDHGQVAGRATSSRRARSQNAARAS